MWQQYYGGGSGSVTVMVILVVLGMVVAEVARKVNVKVVAL